GRGPRGRLPAQREGAHGPHERVGVLEVGEPVRVGPGARDQQQRGAQQEQRQARQPALGSPGRRRARSGVEEHGAASLAPGSRRLGAGWLTIARLDIGLVLLAARRVLSPALLALVVVLGLILVGRDWAGDTGRLEVAGARVLERALARSGTWLALL